MAAKLIPGTAELSAHWLLFGDEVVNTVYAQKATDTPWTDEELEDAAYAMYGALGGTLLTQLSHDIELIDVTATDKSVYGGGQFVYVEAGPQVGAIASDSLPGGSAFVVKLSTGRVGRSYRGRNYIAGIPESAAIGGAVSGGFAGNAVTAYEGIANALTLAGFTQVIVSRQLNGVERTVPVTIPVTNVSYTTIAIRSQRRRNLGIGS